MMPSVTRNANSEIMFIDAPLKGKNRNEPRIEIGIPNMTQNARRGSRNRPNISNTSDRPTNAFLRRRSIRS